jgi:glyoxalase family protein
MNSSTIGLHHVTAIAGRAQRNYDFYARILGLRLVKKTVATDNPLVYQLYYGDEVGTPGTLLSFLSPAAALAGRPGVGQASALRLSVPPGSFPFWLQRLVNNQVPYRALAESFGEPGLGLTDPDGLPLELVISNVPDPRVPWSTDEVSAEVAIRGLHAVQLSLASATDTVHLLTEVFGFHVIGQLGDRCRLALDAGAPASLIDVVELPPAGRGQLGGGLVHHVTLQVADEAALHRVREMLVRRGLPVTRQDRQYFPSLSFREPGGVLFEIATDNPGFMVDEPRAELGTHLLLPPQHEPRRAQILAQLPLLH